MARRNTIFNKASFFGIEFPFTEVSVQGGIRHHIHEYPHSAGGDIEKLGRKLYTIRFKAFFQDVEGSLLNKRYPDLYPSQMRNLRSFFEEQKTADLLIPTVGTIQAMAINWTQVCTNQDLSGETMDLEFLEAQDSAYLTTILEDGDVSIDIAADALDLEVKTLWPPPPDLPDGQLPDPTLPRKPSIFDSINDAVSSFLAIRDQVGLYSQLVEAKILRLADLCREADRTVDVMKGADGVRLLRANRDLWESAQKLVDNVTSKPSPIQFYTTPKLMTVSEVAVALARFGVKATDLLQLNAFEDAFAIAPNTRVRYFNSANA